MNCAVFQARQILIATTGTHGDVVPYLALAKGLKQAGHHVKLVASNEFASMAREYGVAFASIGVDSMDFFRSQEGRQLAGGNVFALMRAMKQFFIPAVDKMLHATWREAQGADLIIYNYAVLSGSHIMEKLQIPGIVCSYLPVLHPSTKFPLFGLPNLGKILNKWSYALNRLSSLPYHKVIQQWRKNILDLPPRWRFANDLVVNKQPVAAMYNCCPHILDTGDHHTRHVKTTGYWFLDETPKKYQIPDKLQQFLQAGAAPVYVTFGSVPHKNIRQLIRMVVQALELTGNRGVLGLGASEWLDLDLPDTVLAVEYVPYDWLFERVKAVIHHGGYGTIMSVLRAAKPALICPFFQDQPFWGKRLYQLGLGGQPIAPQHLSAETLAKALREMCSDSLMQERLAALKEKIMNDRGVSTAVQFVQTILDERLR